MDPSETFFSSVQSEYHAIIETAWELLAQPFSLYLRGSALDRPGVMRYRPWDIDLVLFAANPDPASLAAIKTHVRAFNLRRRGGIPPLDLTITDHRTGSMRTAQDWHLWLVLKGSSLLLRGIEQEWLRTPGLIREERLQILAYSQSILDGRLMRLRHGPYHSAADTDSRCRHVVKHLIRQGNVIRYVREDIFTRSVEYGASILDEIIGPKQTGGLVGLMDHTGFDQRHIAFLHTIHDEIKRKTHAL